MTGERGVRSVLATVVGYVLLAVVGYVALRLVVGTLFWLVRAVIVVAVVIGLLVVYLRLKLPDD